MSNNKLVGLLSKLSDEEKREMLGVLEAITPAKKSPKPKGADSYNTEEGSLYTISLLLDAYNHKEIKRIVDYKGKKSSTVRTKYYRGLQFVRDNDLLPDGFDMACVKVKFFRLYGEIIYSQAIKELKNYKPKLDTPKLTREEWKSQLVSWLNSMDGDFELKDNILLTQEDINYVKRSVPAECIVIVEDTWIKLISPS
jgi:hypothetical protein